MKVTKFVTFVTKQRQYLDKNQVETKLLTILSNIRKLTMLKKMGKWSLFLMTSSKISNLLPKVDSVRFIKLPGLMVQLLIVITNRKFVNEIIQLRSEEHTSELQ